MGNKGGKHLNTWSLAPLLPASWAQLYSSHWLVITTGHIQSLQWCSSWNMWSEPGHSSFFLPLFHCSFLMLQHVFFTGCSVFSVYLLQHVPCPPWIISYTYDFVFPHSFVSSLPLLWPFLKCFHRHHTCGCVWHRAASDLLLQKAPVQPLPNKTLPIQCIRTQHI